MSSTNAGPKDASGSPTCERRRPLPAITSSRAIGQLLRTGRRLRDRHVTLVYAPGGGPHGACLAVVAPRRAGSAVQRNRIRRILREEARLAQSIRTLPLDLALCWRGPIHEPGAGRAAHAEAARLLRKLAGGSSLCSPKQPSG